MTLEKPKNPKNLISIAATALVVPCIFATVALPAYAYSPEAAESAFAKEQALVETDAQELTTASDATSASVDRAAFSASSEAEAKRARYAASYAAYTGPTAADYLANPPYPSYSTDQLVAVAKQYLGTPYQYGGGTPAGFDCSGFTAYVFAQFGIALPHSSAAQGRLGTPISAADALPGDLVIMSGGSHVGIWLGGGMMIDAPQAGGVVSIRAPYTSNYYFVRVGI